MTDTLDKRIAIGSAVKSLGGNRVGGYLIKFTDEDRRDLYGEYFDSKTNLQLDDFPIKGVPALFHHGLNDVLQSRGIGKIDTVEVSDKGVWVEAILKEHDDYIEDVKMLIDEGVLGWSSGALPQAVRVSDTGHIDHWPVIEASLTHTPAMPFDTAITSIRSLKPFALREVDNQLREVAITANDGAVINLYVDNNGVTATDNLTEPQTTGDKKVNANFKGKLAALPAFKMLGEEELAQVMQLIEDYMSMTEEEIKMDEGELDDDATRAGEEEVAEAVEEVIEEVEDAKAVMSAMNQPETVKMIVQAFMKGYATKIEAKRQARRNLIAEAMSDAKAATNGASKKSQAGGVKGAIAGNRIEVGDNLKYAHLTAGDMAFGLVASRANSGNRYPMEIDNPLNYVTDEYMRNFAAKAVKSIADAPNTAGMTQQQRQDAIKSWQTQKATVPFRADELNATDIAAQGLEWVGDYWSNEVWEFAREDSLFDRFVAGGMMTFDIPDGSDSIKIPTAASDPTVYSAPETNDVDAVNNPETVVNFNAFGTGSVTLTPGQLMLGVSLSRILGEDSIVQTGPYVNSMMTTVLTEHIVKAIINGDTTITTNNNINLNDGTPGTGISRPYYLVTDGFRHHGLVDTTADGRDGGGTLTISDFLETMKLLPIEVRSRRGNLLFIVDGNTEAAALALPEIATDDVRRTSATITSGVLQNVYGIDVVTTEHLPLTGTAGTIPGAGGTVGTILLPYLPYWAFAYKRRITLETERNIRSQTDDYVASVRFGLKRRGADALAMTYNTTT